MLKDTDFEFPKRGSELDRVWVEWNNLTNDKEKRCYCNELEEVIKTLEDELDSKNKEVDKLNNTRKQLGNYLAVSIIIILGVCGIFVLH
jgi:predicted RNase H-like nuclease (RuvC/YqgF family)